MSVFGVKATSRRLPQRPLMTQSGHTRSFGIKNLWCGLGSLPASPPTFSALCAVKVTPVGTGPSLGYAAMHKENKNGGCNAGMAAPQRTLYAWLE